MSVNGDLNADLLVGPDRQVPDTLHLAPGSKAGGQLPGEGEEPSLSGLQLPGPTHWRVQHPAGTEDKGNLGLC